MTNSDAAMFPVFASCALFGCVFSWLGLRFLARQPPGARTPLSLSTHTHTPPHTHCAVFARDLGCSC